MTHAIILAETGTPEVLKWGDWNPGSVGPTQALVTQTYSGLNFIDTYYRSGTYKPPKLPMVLGREGVGIVEEVGADVTDIKRGDRVTYVSQFGSYSGQNVVEASILIPVPKALKDDEVAAMMLKGMTAQYLMRQTYNVGPGTTLLYHAAAGGVGLIACQWASHLGATVIGTVGSSAKKEIARANGCEHVIDYSIQDVVEQVMHITDGKGVNYVCDGVGAETYEKSISVLQHHGTIAVDGAASGPILPESFAKLPPERFLVRTTLPGYTKKRERLLACATDLFNMVQSGVISIAINQRYNLRDTPQAHEDLEARRTTGSSVLEIDQ